MDDSNVKLYHNFLFDLLDNDSLDLDKISSELKVNLYLLLLTLNNNYYQESSYQNEKNIINDFVRKINNLKVKICLHRKDTEIDSIINTLLDIYEKNLNIINKYNRELLDISDIIKSKDRVKLSKLSDSITGTKIYLDNIRKNNVSLLSLNTDSISYKIDDNKIDINNNLILLDDFYLIYSYLLDVNNYKNIFLNDNTNNLHKNLITNIIDLISSGKKINNEIIISLTLNHLLFDNSLVYKNINMSDFNINNIKINDLYSFVKMDNIYDSVNSAKWKNVIIPNEYLYQKIKQISSKGMYYFKDNLFIIENNTNDFKLTIGIDEMKKYLKANLSNI